VSGPRRSITALAGVAAALLTTALVPGAALAEGNISLVSVGPDASGNPYDLSVVVNDGNNLQLSGMTVQVLDSGNNVVATPTMAYSSGPYSAQAWTPTTPISQSALPAGTYTVSISATDTSESDSLSGSFSYSYSTSLAVTPSPATVGQGAQTVTFHGSLTGVAPGGTPVSISGAPVSLSISGTSQGQVATTDSNGDFSYPVSGVTQSADYNFTVPGTSTYNGASDDVSVPVAQSMTSISVTPSPPSVTQGSQDVTFSGTISVTPPGGGSGPVGIGTGVPVFLSINNGTPSQVTATTDAAGDFSYQAIGISQTSDYNFSVDSTSLYTSASDDVTIDANAAITTMTLVPTPGTVTQGSQSVTFAGTVSIQPPGGAKTGIGSGIPIFLSIGGGAPTQVTTTTDAAGDYSYTVQGITASTDYNFTVVATSLYTGTSQDEEVPVQQAPTTIAVGASPQFVTFGSQSVTFRGTVTALPPGSTSSVGVGTGVPIYLSTNGGASTAVTTTTNAAGSFSYTASNISADTNFTFSVGATSLYTAASDLVAVDVNPSTTNVAVTATPPDVNLGSSTVKFNGTVTVTPPGGTAESIGPGVAVFLSVGSATPTQIGTTDASGRFADTITGVTQANDYTFNVQAASLYTTGSDTVPIGLDQLNTDVAVTPSQSTVTEGSQNVTFTGKVTGTAPGSSVPENLPAGVPVDLSINKGPAKQIALTNANSQFFYTATGISKVTDFNFSVGSTITYTTGNDDISIGVTPAKTRIASISITPAHLKYGQKATLTGSVQYLSGATWKPLPGQVVHLAEGKTSLGTVLAGPNGTFTASLPSTHGFGWSAMVAAGILTQQATATGNLSIAVPLKFQSFTATLGVNGDVSVHGCLQVTVPVNYAPLSKVALQYEASTRGPWRTLATVQLRDINGPASSCGSPDQSHFTASVHFKLPNAYYRADFPANFSFEGAVSKSFHLWKHLTKITGYSVAPVSVKTKQRITISGRLWQKLRTWQGFGGQKVEYIYNDKGTSFWGSLDSSTASSKGYFKGFAQAGPGTFVAVVYAVYQGSKTDFEVRSPGIDVSINPKKSTDAAFTAAGSSLPVILPPSMLAAASAAHDAITAAVELIRRV